MNFKSYFLVFFMLLIVPMFATKTVRVLPFGRLIADGITAALKTDDVDNLWFTEQRPHAFAANPKGKSLIKRTGAHSTEYPPCATCRTYRKDDKCGYMLTVQTIEEIRINDAKTIDLLMKKNKKELEFYLQKLNKLPPQTTLHSYTISNADFDALSIDDQEKLVEENKKLARHRFIRGRKILIATVDDESIEYVDCVTCKTFYRDGRCGFIIKENTDCCGLFSCLRRLCYRSKKTTQTPTPTGSSASALAGAGSAAKPKDD